ncbi:MAG: hypothetical protein DRP74_00390 [Candidatus Omnitrophota bacterium]|nr:MAG: hypothetical protein DRP74_00390 [Candidatus Omnitrophota bacterium]
MKNKVAIIGAGLSGRIAKYIFGDKATLYGEISKSNKMPFFYIHRFLDSKLTDREILVSSRVIAIDKKNQKHNYLIKTRSRVACGLDSSIGNYTNEGWILNWNRLPNPDVKDRIIDFVNYSDRKCLIGIKDSYIHEIVIFTIDLINICKLVYSSPHEIDYQPDFEYYKIGLKFTPVYSIFENLIQTFYFPDPDIPYYRVTFYQDYMVQEFSEASVSFDKFEFDKILYPGKILPSMNSANIIKSLEQSNIYCLGRYACWQPRMMVHDVWREAIKLKEKLL